MVRWGFPYLEKLAPRWAHRFFLMLFFTPLHYQVPPKEREFMLTAKRTRMKIGQKDIQIYSWGDNGPIVLFVHGWAGRAGQFRKFVPEFLKAGFKVVAFDGPAHGASDGRSTNVADFGAVISAIIDKEGDPAVVIAHSFGGVAAVYAAAQGAPISRLINISTPTIGDEIINTYLRAVNGTPPTGAAFKELVLQRYHKPFDDFTILKLIHQLPRPMELMVVHDREDRDVLFEHVVALKKTYPQIMVHETQGLGHTRILKDPEVIGACLNFAKGRNKPAKEPSNP